MFAALHAALQRVLDHERLALLEQDPVEACLMPGRVTMSTDLCGVTGIKPVARHLSEISGRS
eukprot:5109509-Amphidinium_carterae.1